MLRTPHSRPLSAKQSARLGAYLATGVAASMGVCSDAEAAIVYFDVDPDRTILGGQRMIFGNINLANGTYSTGAYSGGSFALTLQQFGQVSLYNGYGNGSVLWGISGGYVLNLGFGDSISSAITSWDYGYGYLTKNGNGPWTAGANAYAALRFSAGGSDYYYGWANIIYDASTPSATITGFAFEDQVNTAILAGDQGGPAAVPEPGTWAAAALLAGGATFLRWRRRRDEAQKEAA